MEGAYALACDEFDKLHIQFKQFKKTGKSDGKSDLSELSSLSGLAHHRPIVELLAAIARLTAPFAIAKRPGPTRAAETPAWTTSTPKGRIGPPPGTERASRKRGALSGKTWKSRVTGPASGTVRGSTRASGTGGAARGADPRAANALAGAAWHYCRCSGATESPARNSTLYSGDHVSL